MLTDVGKSPILFLCRRLNIAWTKQDDYLYIGKYPCFWVSLHSTIMLQQGDSQIE